MIIGVGIDVVPIERFESASVRTRQLIDRLFTQAERHTAAGLLRTPESLAARFAAKEAVAKALGSPGGMAWHDCEVVVEGSGQPGLQIRGTVAARAELLGVRSWHLSLSHDGGIASAVVIAEG
ncbi:MAG: holo-ACP synthase [Actinomycetota bacterium]|nr:holo-ACP synthase [Actinomycetota bacterium]MDQ2957216.1 holo-ACP synthase [Actinomycetota bacterium]